jgi:hypothetical protein
MAATGDGVILVLLISNDKDGEDHESPTGLDAAGYEMDEMDLLDMVDTLGEDHNDDEVNDVTGMAYEDDDEPVDHDEAVDDDTTAGAETDGGTESDDAERCT